MPKTKRRSKGSTGKSARRAESRNPNVCRVFDLGEVEGSHFISMEFIDGDDLSSLLHRIGRLPHDKAVEIARQLCAGLHAIHQVGVLHRNLIYSPQVTLPDPLLIKVQLR